MKGRDKTPEKQPNEVKIGSLPEKEFRIMMVKMIQDLRKRMEAKTEKMQEMFTKDLEEIKNKQTEMNNTLKGINSRITEAKEWIHILEDSMVWTILNTPTFALCGPRRRREKKKDLRKYLKR